MGVLEIYIYCNGWLQKKFQQNKKRREEVNYRKSIDSFFKLRRAPFNKLLHTKFWSSEEERNMLIRQRKFLTQRVEEIDNLLNNYKGTRKFISTI